MSLLFDSLFEVNRPWGKFIQFTKNEPSTVKILTVNPGEAFSLQYHNEREEFWFVLGGTGTIEIGDKKFDVMPNSQFVIPKGTSHRITAGDKPVEVLEISTGSFDEDDIVRLEDRYGRISS